MSGAPGVNPAAALAALVAAPAGGLPQDFLGFTARQRLRQRVDTRGHRWSWRDNLQAGPVLVLLPGALGTGDMAFRLAEGLGDAVRTLAVGYPSGVAPDALADGLAELLDHLAVRSASIWGSSYGAWWSQSFATRHPQRLDALWLGNMPLDAAAVASQPLFDAAWLGRTGGKEVVATWQQALLQRPASELRDLQLWMLSNGLAPEDFRARLLQVARAPMLPVSASIPNLVVFDCADDAIVGAAQSERVRRRFPQARQLRLDTGGHYPHVTHAADLTVLLRDWLQLN